MRREFLTEQQNHTGYSQVSRETEFDAAGNPTEKIVYTIGHDQISQTSYLPLPQGEGWGEGSIAYFGSDGHGSVRVLYDAASAIVQAAGIPQIYHFDAYGNLLSIGGQSLTTQVSPLTTYLYSGEAFDFTIGQQYLRARWYDPTTGRFNRLDPFFGNQSDPQSFHKYAYVHGDPVNGVDPTGMFLATAGLLISFGVTYKMRNYDFKAVVTGGNILALFMTLGVAPAMAIGAANWYYNSALDPLFVGQRPDNSSNVSKSVWRNNVKSQLEKIVMSKRGTSRDLQVARQVADAYVDLVSSRGTRYHDLQGADTEMFGYGGSYGWLGNLVSGYKSEDANERKCYSWADAMERIINPLLVTSGWRLVRYVDATKASYDPAAALFGILTHNFVSLELLTHGSTDSNSPDVVLDPWATGRPDVFDAKQFDSVWPFRSSNSTR